MKFTKLAATLMCSVVLLCGCTKSSDVVIKVNDTNITRGEFYGDFNKLKKIQLEQLPKEQQSDNSYPILLLKDKFVGDTVARALLKEVFEKDKIEATDEEIAAKRKKLINKVGSEEEMKKILKENSITEQRFKEDLANEVKIDKLVKKLSPKSISEKDAQQFYNMHKDQFKVDETVHAYHILISTDESEVKRKIADADKDGKLSSSEIDKKVKEEIAKKESIAKDIQAQVTKNPKKFQELAKAKSDDPGTATKGGDLGLITKDSVVKEFGEQAFKQKVGTISPVIKTQFGYHIIYVTEKNKAGTKAFNDVKKDLMEYLDQEIKVATFKKYMNGLKSKAKIEYVDENLNPENIQKQIQESIQSLMPKQEQKDKK